MFTAQPDDKLVQDLVGCCHFTSTMIQMVRSQFSDPLEGALDSAQFESLDAALRSVLKRAEAALHAARMAHVSLPSDSFAAK